MASYILDKAHEVVRGVVKPGDTVIDATVGNGWDTVFLARLVGSTGRVIGFDIQTAAIDATRRRLAAEDLLERCDLFEQSHDDLAGCLDTLEVNPPVAVMFNLGYLPGGDRSITTTPSVTVRSLDKMLRLLAPKGVITVVVYKGHRGASEEFDSVAEWADSLDPQRFNCDTVEDPVAPPHAPSLLVVTKR